MGGTVADTSGESGRGRGERGRDTTILVLRRLLVTVIRVCVVAVVVSVLLAVSLLVATRVSRARAVTVFWSEKMPPPRYLTIPACQRLYALPLSPSCPRSGFKHPLLIFNSVDERVLTRFE